MGSKIINIGSVIGNQVIGTQTNLDQRERDTLEAIKHLQLILEQIRTDTTLTVAKAQEAQKAVEELKAGLQGTSPTPGMLERAMSSLGDIASVATLVDQVRPFLKGLL